MIFFQFLFPFFFSQRYNKKNMFPNSIDYVIDGYPTLIKYTYFVNF